MKPNLLMKTSVAHFLRKYSQLKASFIKNQIEHHVEYSPVAIYKLVEHKTSGGFAEVENSALPKLELSKSKNFFSRYWFKILKLINKNDVEEIGKFIEEHKVRLLHFHYGTDTGIYLPFLKKNKLPTIVSFYGYDCSSFPKYLFGYGKKYLQNRVFPYATKILAMSPDMKNDLLKIGCPPEKIIVHHHGNDVKRFYLERNYINEKATVNFLIISELVTKKGHLFLMESFKKAHEKNPNIMLTIIGDGVCKEKILNYISSQKLADFIRFEGSVVYKSEKHLDYLKNHDVFVHPSITDTKGDKEGIPGAIIEAMASGLPVISTFHGGIPYIIKSDERGLLVNENDTSALTEAILKLAESESLREKFGKAGQNFAIKELDILIREKELEKVYNQLIN
jgi:colanic acid/amylovoran biosynthesis glycosyltransferase